MDGGRAQGAVKGVRSPRGAGWTTARDSRRAGSACLTPRPAGPAWSGFLFPFSLPDTSRDSNLIFKSKIPAEAPRTAQILSGAHPRKNWCHKGSGPRDLHQKTETQQRNQCRASSKVLGEQEVFKSRELPSFTVLTSGDFFLRQQSSKS